MQKEILVSAQRLNDLITANDAVVFDCRFDFSDTAKGRADWLSGHVPTACYAHMDDDLSSPILGHTGRHPLPDTDRFALFLARAGWTPGRMLVCYDEGSNAIASRLWWLMRYYGNDAALLDGGLAAWTQAGFALEEGIPLPDPAAPVELNAAVGQVVSSSDVLDGLDQWAVLDARAAERFSGAVEPLDTQAGHIPGALNRPFAANLQANGLFKSASALREEFEQVIEGRALADIVHSCGSGVTACHNLFAMEFAGMSGTRLYAGSWSEWIRDPNRPIATGA